ncbi:guanylate kinase-like [Anthonomus grandis grandis]|uniref:guanylate kinase-like n=1 Tax=Anthonomus grandis grandis TaxID=2921223 RepID=UPI00216610F4|nr:guanylate kinase-like [Anthonomus grandis grandis]
MIRNCFWFSMHRPIVFCGPSGSGKSTLVTKMMQDFPDKFGFSVSHTTRNPRPGEIDGNHYHFTTKDKMQKAIAEGKFIETAVFSGNIYGTSRDSVDAVTNQGKVCVLDIDVQGVKQIKQTSFNPWFIFVEPPSLEELESRLRARNTESEDSLKQRLDTARQELIYGKTSNIFDLVITNDNLEHAYSILKKFLLENVLKASVSNGIG